MYTVYSDSLQAETYHNCATSLVHSTSNRETLLSFRLCTQHIITWPPKIKLLRMALNSKWIQTLGFTIARSERTRKGWGLIGLSVACAMQRRMSSRRQAPRALVEQSIGVLEERAQAAPLSVPALCAFIHPPEDVAEVACDVGGDVVADNVARSANAPKSAPVMMMRAWTGWCNHPMMTLGQVWQTCRQKRPAEMGSGPGR